jgi:hypothetical protein
MFIPPSKRDCVCFVYANIKGEAKPVGTALFPQLPVNEKLGAPWFRRHPVQRVRV